MNEEDILRAALSEHARTVKPGTDAGRLNARLQRADRDTMLTRMVTGVAAVAVVTAVGVGATRAGASRDADVETVTSSGTGASVPTPGPSAQTTPAPVTDPDPEPGTGPSIGSETTSTSPKSTVPPSTQPSPSTPPVSKPSAPPSSVTAPTSTRPTASSAPPMTKPCGFALTSNSGSGNPFDIAFGGSVSQGGAAVTVAVFAPGGLKLALTGVRADAIGNFSGTIHVPSAPAGSLTVKYGGGGCYGPATFTHS